MRIEAHGIAVEVPDGWEARIFRHPGGEPTLHAGSFPLPHSDGEFGSRATAAMPSGAAFLALTEYRPDRELRPGTGIFASPAPPSALADGDFHPRTLLIARAGQEGLQRFFTAQGRPFCLYVVRHAPREQTAHEAAAAAARAARHLGGLTSLLGSLRIHPRKAGP